MKFPKNKSEIGGISEVTPAKPMDSLINFDVHGNLYGLTNIHK
jgi:hypothetical protein